MHASSEVQRHCNGTIHARDRLIVKMQHAKQESSVKEHVRTVEMESVNAELARAKEAVRCKESEMDRMSQETNASRRFLSSTIDGLQRELEQARVSEKEALD